MFLPRVARIPPRRARIRRNWSILHRRIGRWRKRARWVRFKLKAAPRALRIIVIAMAIVAVFSATNLIYHLLHRPTEFLSPVSGAFNKSPAETWRHYAPLFRQYSTVSISPELLAALAQAEGAGNPPGKHLLAMAFDLEPVCDLPACLEQRRHVPDDRRRLCRGPALLHPPPYRR